MHSYQPGCSLEQTVLEAQIVRSHMALSSKLNFENRHISAVISPKTLHVFPRPQTLPTCYTTPMSSGEQNVLSCQVGNAFLWNSFAYRITKTCLSIFFIYIKLLQTGQKCYAVPPRRFPRRKCQKLRIFIYVTVLHESFSAHSGQILYLIYVIYGFVNKKI